MSHIVVPSLDATLPLHSHVLYQMQEEGSIMTIFGATVQEFPLSLNAFTNSIIKLMLFYSGIFIVGDTMWAR